MTQMIHKEGSVAPNDITKDPKQQEKNTQRIRGHSIPQQFTFNDSPINLIPRGGWEKLVPGQANPGVEFITFTLEGVDPAIADGAKIRIPAGTRTLVQCNKSETEFSEVPQSGRLLFLSVSPKGEFFMDYFETAERDNSKLKGRIRQGWMMCWYALKGQSDSFVLEYEKPGFSSAELPTVETGANSFNGIPIPEFWATVKALDNGREAEVLEKLKTVIEK